MNYTSDLLMKSFLILSPMFLLSPSSFAADKAVTKMVISTPSQSVMVGKCSATITVQAQNNTSQAANVPINTTIFFTGSSSSLKFYSDSSCASAVTTLTMSAGTNAKNFYFKGSVAGTQKIIVATFIRSNKFVSSYPNIESLQ